MAEKKIDVKELTSEEIVKLIKLLAVELAKRPPTGGNG